MARGYGVLADDLTGAMDAGVQLVNKGITASVVFDARNIKDIQQDSDVIIVDTESRNIDPERAYDKVSRAVDTLKESGMELIYKKVDSTMRGNIGSEMDAVLDRKGKQMMIMAPALPYNGRTTIEGIHYVNGVPLAETELARDPFSPVKNSYIPAIIQEQCNRKAALLGLNTLRKGEGSIQGFIRKAMEDGFSLIISDAEDEKDLELLAGGIRETENRALLCGSAGLFTFLERAYGSLANKDKAPNEITAAMANNKPKPVVAICGSPALMSRKQVDFAACNLKNTVLIRANSEELLIPLEHEVDEALDKGMNIIIDGTDASKEELLKRYINSPDMLKERSAAVQKLLAQFLGFILDRTRLKGLILLGGDTAVSMCRHMGALGIRIAGEVEPYIPFGTLIGGENNGLVVVTKAGGFGNEATLAKAMETLEKDQIFTQ